MYPSLLPVVGCCCLVFAGTVLRAQPGIAPPEGPAQVRIGGNSLEFLYGGNPILEGRLDQPAAGLDIRQMVDSGGNGLTQVLKLTTRDGSSLQITGDILGSLEAFPCAADRSPGLSGEIVRSVVGLSHSLLNRAVYDRKQDWVLSVDENPAMIIVPGDTVGGRIRFRIRIRGSEIVLRFRPGFYRRHRGLTYYKPWTYDPWKGSVAGWCSWFAYHQDIDEGKIRHTAEVLSRKLLPFGLDYLQIDDGYEQEPSGMPESWLKPNVKFPSGLASLAAYIRSKGLKPGIWSNMSFQQKDSAMAHKGLFVRDPGGLPASGNWIGYILDGSNPQALDQILRPRFRGFSQMGWEYYKVDALRHLRYEGYNSHPEYFQKIHKDPVEAYRSVVRAIRQETGKDHFLLACWGIRPELIGLVDGCRIGNDGYCWQELTQYNSFNNVVWRNDPDHMQLASPDAYTDCLLTSMTGSLYMLTDPPQYYDSSNLEPALHTLPILPTRPGQLYDVDPSRSDNLGRVGSEVSGSGPRVFDASCSSPYDLFLEEINTSYENWMLLARAGTSQSSVRMADLGLDPASRYLVFEFWTKSLLGIFSGSFSFPAIDTRYRCQLFCIRKLLDHPQLVATSRHYSCGALELERLDWKGQTLSGSSRLVARDPYIIYIHEPPGFHFLSLECPGAERTSNQVQGSLRELTLFSPTGGSVTWRVNYSRDEALKSKP